MALSITPKPLSSTSFGVLGSVSAAHLVNDMMQSLILAIYPVLKGSFHLTFGQIGLITLTYQLTASLLQPCIGMWTDRHPVRYSLPISMALTLVGLALLGFAPNFGTVIAAAAIIGSGSAIFHPESSRVARMAAGGRYGLAQSLFQVGGNTGAALGPLLAAAVVAPYGQHSVAWFSLSALVGIVLLLRVSRWSSEQRARIPQRTANKSAVSPLARKQVIWAMAVLLALIFSKYFYVAGISSFLTFYLIDRFGLTVQASQYYLFLFLISSAVGTLMGGPIGDKIGRKAVIWASILGVAPFALALPHANLFWTTALIILIGLILSSAFSAIVVYGQELIPNKVGTVAGLFFGLAFGVGGLGAAVLGLLADHTSIDFVYQVIAYLPLLGAVAYFLPDERRT